MGRPSGLLSFAPHDGSCGAKAWLCQSPDCKSWQEIFCVGQRSIGKFALRFVGETQSNNEVADIFLAKRFDHHRIARTDFDALSQNLIVGLLCKFSAGIGKRLLLATMLKVRTWPL
jgi:hypothetical protein